MYAELNCANSRPLMTVWRISERSQMYEQPAKPDTHEADCDRVSPTQFLEMCERAAPGLETTSLEYSLIAGPD
jgi:hypothetical protein